MVFLGVVLPQRNCQAESLFCLCCSRVESESKARCTKQGDHAVYNSITYHPYISNHTGSESFRSRTGYKTYQNMICSYLQLICSYPNQHHSRDTCRCSVSKHWLMKIPKLKTTFEVKVSEPNESAWCQRWQNSMSICLWRCMSIR